MTRKTPQELLDELEGIPSSEQRAQIEEEVKAVLLIVQMMVGIMPQLLAKAYPDLAERREAVDLAAHTAIIKNSIQGIDTNDDIKEIADSIIESSLIF